VRKIIVYERVSSDRQDLARQAVQRDRARDDYPDQEPHVIQDDGVSAFKHSIFERRGGKELCDLIESGEVEAVYVDAMDRLGRPEELEWASFRAICVANGTRLMIDGRELRDDFAGRLEGSILAALARRESEEKSHRMRGSRRERAKAGKFGGGPIPYGYRASDTPGLLEEDPGEAALVRRIFTEYVSGRSQRQIARSLALEGHKTKRGGQWAQAIIRRILANPLYKGWGQQPALVSPETWEEARRLREALTRTKGGGRGPAPKGSHLFRHGHLRCGRCGEAMIPRTIRARSKTGKPYEAYLCHRRVRGGPEACSQTPIPRAHVDEAVFDYFERVTLDVAATREQVARSYELRLQEARALRESAERDFRQARASLDKLDRDYGSMPDERWNRLASKYEAELERAEREAGLLAQMEESVQEEGSQVDADEAVLEHLDRLRSAVVGRVRGAEGLEAVRAALVVTFESFTLHHRDSEAAQEKVLDPDLFLVWSTYYLEPQVRPEALGGSFGYEHEDGRMISFPKPRRTALPLPNTDTAGRTT
jgi:site-specific DNA recombinase